MLTNDEILRAIACVKRFGRGSKGLDQFRAAYDISEWTLEKFGAYVQIMRMVSTVNDVSNTTGKVHIIARLSESKGTVTNNMIRMYNSGMVANQRTLAFTVEV